MKKIISILLALAIVFTFSACSVKKIQRDEDGKVIEEQPKQKSYSEMSFDEKLEYMSSREREAFATEENTLLAPACLLGATDYGYINTFGEWVIEPQFCYTYSFNEGYAPVIDKYNDYEIIDTSGAAFTSTANLSRKLSMRAARHFYELFVAAVFDTGYEQTKMYYSVDGITQITAEKLPTTKGVSYGSKQYFAVATAFSHGYAAVMRRTNESVIEQYGAEKVSSKGYEQSACIINQIGEIEATLPAGLDIYDYSMNSNGTITVGQYSADKTLYGVCNLNGELIIPCEYYLIEYCEGGLYLAADTNGFFGYLDETGKTVINFKYTAAYAFSEGYAAVCEESKWGVINASGDYIIAPSFDYIAPLKYQDADVNLNSAAFNEGVAAIRYGDYWALIDTKCKILDAVYAPGLDECPYSGVGNGYVIFTEYTDGVKVGCGVLDLAGNLVLEPSYEYIGAFGN